MEEIIAAPHHETARGQVPFSSTHRLQMGDQPKSGADSRSTHVQACWSDHTSRGWSFWILNHLLFMLNWRTSCFFDIPQLQAHYLGRDIMLAFEEDVGSILAQAPKYSEAIHLADEHLQLQPLLPTGLRFLGLWHDMLSTFSWRISMSCLSLVLANSDMLTKTALVFHGLWNACGLRFLLCTWKSSWTTDWAVT